MYYIGIDLGGTNIAVGIVDEYGKIVHKASVPTIRGRSYQEIAKDMANLSLKIVHESGLKVSDIEYIGIGAPGTINHKDGILLYSNNLNFYNAYLRDEIQKYVDLKIYMDNDANCAALAENVFGAAKGSEFSVTITLGTGVGSGIIIDKKIYSGFNFAGGELGHAVIVVDGEPCTCGQNGCWEAYSSATALIGQTVKAAKQNQDSILNKLINNDYSKIDAKTAFDAAKKGDKVGMNVVNQYIKYLSVGIINVINIFQPEVLVIGGGVCKEGEYLLKPLKELVDKGIYTKGTGMCQTKIKVAIMGNDAGIVGAAMLGLQ